MTPRLVTTLTQDRGTLTARATLAEPDVRLTSAPGEAPVLTVEEGGVVVELAFADLDCVRHFQVRVGLVLPPTAPEPTPPRRRR